MNELRNDLLRYLTISATDEEWGIVVTTVGYHPAGLRLSAFPASGEV